MVSIGAKLRAGNGLIPRDGSDSDPKADAICESFGSESEIGAGALVAVPVNPERHSIIQARVDAGIDVVQPSVFMTADEVKPDSLCAGEQGEQQQEEETQHDTLRGYGESLGLCRATRN